MAETNNCGYWLYLGEPDVPKGSGSMKEIDPNQLWPGVEPISEYTESHSEPRILTRCEKGQALTHLEMDFNLASLFHKLNTSSVSASYTEIEEDTDSDIYFQRHKPTRAEEMRGLFATFSYAPVVNDSQSVIQNPFQTIKIQHTTDEIRYKLANERIPGTLDIREDFRVTGSIFTRQNLSVSGNAEIKGNTRTNTLYVSDSACITGSLRVGGTQSIEGDLYVVGNLYVNGVLFGNLSQPQYNTSDYAVPHETKGPVDPIQAAFASVNPSVGGQGEGEPTRGAALTQDTYTREEVDQLLQNLREELLREINGSSER